MEFAPIVISILAFCLSALTFYWSHLRVHHKLHLVRIDKIGEFSCPQFAMVNSGTKDVLITSIVGRFEHSNSQDKGSSTYPSQRVEIGEGPSMLLKAGTAVQCKITFLEKFTHSFVKLGKLRKESVPEIYEFEFKIDVSWVDYEARSYKATASIGKYGFSVDVGICMFSPLEAKHDLYNRF